MDVWKKHRSNLAKADVMPIGEKPTGRSFSGFYISDNGKPQYLLLFREATKNSSFVIKCPAKTANTEVLASNTTANITVIDGFIYGDLSKPRSDAFIKLS